MEDYRDYQGELNNFCQKSGSYVKYEQRSTSLPNGTLMWTVYAVLYMNDEIKKYSSTSASVKDAKKKIAKKIVLDVDTKKPYTLNVGGMGTVYIPPHVIHNFDVKSYKSEENIIHKEFINGRVVDNIQIAEDTKKDVNVDVIVDVNIDVDGDKSYQQKIEDKDIVLIDGDNVPNEIFHNFNENVMLLFFVGKVTKVSPKVLECIDNNDNFTLIRANWHSKDATDVLIAMYLASIARLNPNNRYHLISGDSIFQSVLSAAKMMNIDCTWNTTAPESLYIIRYT